MRVRTTSGVRFATRSGASTSRYAQQSPRLARDLPLPSTTHASTHISVQDNLTNKQTSNLSPNQHNSKVTADRVRDELSLIGFKVCVCSDAPLR